MFWDTSAVIALVVAETGSATAAGWLAAHPLVVVWWATRVECTSALARLERDGTPKGSDLETALARLRTLGEAWAEIEPTAAVRGHALRLLRRHALRAADALQLGAALVWAGDRPDGHRFATFDLRLAHAARGEGFVVPREAGSSI